MNKKFLYIFGFFLLAGVFIEVMLAVKDARSGPRCQSHSCIGLDSRELRCDSKVETLTSKTTGGLTIELRYSPSCNASWAKSVVPVGSTLYVQDTKGQEFGHYIVPPDGIMTAHYGNMGGGKELRACARLPNTQDVCTVIPRSEK